MSERTRRVGWRTALGLIAVAIASLSVFAWRRADPDRATTVTVRRGPLTAQLSVTGTLHPIESLTYRSPLGGREMEIMELAPEGTRVNPGDLLIRLDTTALQLDLERARQDLRQSELDLQLAEIERQDAEDEVRSVANGDGAVTAEEARVRVDTGEKKVERLTREVSSLQPLLARGFITRDELRKASDALEQAEQELALAKKKRDVFVGLTRPHDAERARLRLAQKSAQLENARAHAHEAHVKFEELQTDLDACRIYARRSGLVVYEDLLTVSPRRKIHVGDRVTASQGLITIPEVRRMRLDVSISEAEVHRVHPGQRVVVRPEAFGDARLTATVTRVGTLARVSIERPFDEKRFDVSIELDPSALELRPEMTARAEIVVGTREQVLLVPVNAVMERQGRFVARVDNGSNVAIRPVDLGESNEAFIEVVAGLREGERVVSEPSRTSAR